MRRRFLFILCLAVIVGLGGCLFFQRATGGASQSAPGGADSTGPVRARPGAPGEGPGKGLPPSNDAFDFVAALEAARAMRDPALRSREFGSLLRRWIGQDIERALAYVRQLPQGDDYTVGLLLVLAAIGKQDPERCLVLAGELAVTREQHAIYSSLFAQMGETDPTTAALRLVLVPAGEGRENAVRALAEGWARVDFAAAYAWAQTVEGSERSQAVESTLSALIFTDPLRAIELAQTSLEGDALNRTLAFALETLTPLDPAAAAAIVSLLPAGEVQAAAALEVARELAAKNPTEALSWAKSLAEGETRRFALNNILDVWAAKDPAAASQHVIEMTPGPEQRGAAEHVARTLAAGDALTAIAWARRLPNDGTQDAILIITVSAWAARDPAGAANWAAARVPGAVQTEGLKGALSYWILHDAGAARSFVSGLRGDVQVQAAVAIAPALAQSDAPAAVQWAQSLSTPQAREAALIAAYSRWTDNAPAEAESSLTSANLSPEIKGRLRRGE